MKEKQIKEELDPKTENVIKFFLHISAEPEAPVPVCPRRDGGLNKMSSFSSSSVVLMLDGNKNIFTHERRKED